VFKPTQKRKGGESFADPEREETGIGGLTKNLWLWEGKKERTRDERQDSHQPEVCLSLYFEAFVE